MAWSERGGSKLLISLEQWKAFRFKNESAFRGNDQYSQGVRDTLAVVDQFLAESGKAVPNSTEVESMLHQILSKNRSQVCALPKTYEVKMETTVCEERNEYRARAYIVFEGSEEKKG